MWKLLHTPAVCAGLTQTALAKCEDGDVFGLGAMLNESKQAW